MSTYAGGTPQLVLILLASYLVGAIPFGFIIGRLRGVDITQRGSGNIGATNALRVLGSGPAILTLALDVGKGLTAAYLGTHLATAFGREWGGTLAGLTAMAGHNWSVFLGLRGGRGVATGLGAVVSLLPSITLVGVAVFVVAVALTRYVSLGSILAAATLGAGVLVTPQPVPLRVLGGVGAALVIWRHLPNIRRLLQGRESRLGGRPGAAR